MPFRRPRLREISNAADPGSGLIVDPSGNAVANGHIPDGVTGRAFANDAIYPVIVQAHIVTGE